MPEGRDGSHIHAGAKCIASIQTKKSSSKFLKVLDMGIFFHQKMSSFSKERLLFLFALGIYHWLHWKQVWVQYFAVLKNSGDIFVRWSNCELILICGKDRYYCGCTEDAEIWHPFTAIFWGFVCIYSLDWLCRIFAQRVGRGDTLPFCRATHAPKGTKFLLLLSFCFVFVLLILTL